MGFLKIFITFHVVDVLYNIIYSWTELEMCYCSYAYSLHIGLFSQIHSGV